MNEVQVFGAVAMVAVVGVVAVVAIALKGWLRVSHGKTTFEAGRRSSRERRTVR
jgi:hypothetical protein